MSMLLLAPSDPSVSRSGSWDKITTTFRFFSAPLISRSCLFLNLPTVIILSLSRERECGVERTILVEISRLCLNSFGVSRNKVLCGGGREMSNRLSWSRTRVADLHVQTQHVRGGHVTNANYDVVKGHPVLAWRNLSTDCI